MRFILFRQQQDGCASCCLGSHHENLSDVGSLRGTADKRTVAVVGLVELNAFVGLVHVIDDLTLGQQDDQVLGDEADGLLLHRLGDPYAGILGHAELPTDDTHISSVQVASTSYIIWISRGNRDLGQVRGNLLGIGEQLLDDVVDILTFLHFNHMTSHTLCHRDVLYQWVGVGDSLDVVERRHVIFLLYVLSVL